jgi:hypothetical protein
MMLGTDGVPGSGVEAPDEVSELLKNIEKGVGGSNGGNGAGNGTGGNDGDDDPLRGQPIDARALVDACKQVADFAAKLVEMATDRESALIKRAMALIEKSEARTLGELLELFKAEAEARQSLTPILVKRFEAIEYNLGMIGKHLGATYEGDEKRAADDAGSGP